jgi:hypothetical protein
MFKTSIKPITDISLPDLTNLVLWDRCSRDLENPALHVGKISKDGEPYGYIVAEPILVIENYSCNPSGDPEDGPAAGDALGAALAEHSPMRTMYVIPPDCPELPNEQLVRVCFYPSQKQRQKQEWKKDLTRWTEHTEQPIETPQENWDRYLAKWGKQPQS